MRSLRLPLAAMTAFFLGRITVCGASPFAGRWDFIVAAQDQTYPAWMELVEDAGGPRIRIQRRTGSVVPGQDVKLEGAHLTFSFGRNLSWDLTAAHGELSGTQKS